MELIFDDTLIKLKESEIACLQKTGDTYKFQNLKKCVVLKYLKIAASMDKKYTELGKKITGCFLINKLTKLDISTSQAIKIAKIYTKHIQKQKMAW